MTASKTVLGDLLSLPSFSSSHSISIAIVRSAISNWDPRASPSASFLRATSLLHSHLLRLSASSSEHAQLITNIHTLLQSAMQHLRESLQRHLFSISAPDLTSDKIATIRSIAQTMLSTGHGEECLSAYQSIRQSNLKSQMVRLGFDQSANQPKAVRKLKWEILDCQMKSWSHIAPVVVRSLCSEEQRLCDETFAASPESVRASIFCSITCETALRFLSFPETVAVHSKPSPEKLFRLLDMYVMLSNLLPDIESVFGSEPASSVRSQAESALGKLSEAIRAVISTFDLAIQNDPLKSYEVPGRWNTPTNPVRDELSGMSLDSELYLHEILVDLPQNCTPLFFEASNLKDESVVLVTIKWMLFVLLCKIDSKATTYSDVALSYLFMANNLRYIVTKVRSCRLKEILGDEWVSEHGRKACRFMEGHVRSGWAHMSGMLTAKDEAEDVDRLLEFEMTFEKALKDRKDWIIADASMKEEVRLRVVAMLVPAYREWYQTREDFVAFRYLPEDVRKRIMRFYGGSDSN